MAVDIVARAIAIKALNNGGGSGSTGTSVYVADNLATRIDFTSDPQAQITTLSEQVIAIQKLLDNEEVAKVVAINFTNSDFTLSNDGSYSISIDNTITTFNNNLFTVCLDSLEGEVYQQLADSVTKMEDGSILLENIIEPFTGRFLLVGNTALSIEGEVVDNVLLPLYFTASDFILSEEDNSYSLTFSNTQTTYNNSEFIVCVDLLENEKYQQLADSVTKSADGSVILNNIQIPFNGRLLLLGQNIINKTYVTDISYDTATNELTIQYNNGTQEIIPLSTSGITVDLEANADSNNPIANSGMVAYVTESIQNAVGMANEQLEATLNGEQYTE